MDEYRKYEPIFGSWHLVRLLGKGSFGKVFEIAREEFGTTYRSALKIITVPQDDDDIKTRMSEGTDLASISEYYEGILREIVNENEIMAQLKGNSNIVSYEDHQIIPHADGIGYDILIRMELLTPLIDRMMERPLDEKEVVRLGIDMCKALEVCHRKNIIHRDIKPQNIFLSENGDYKLGDFGIARTIEKTTGGMSKKGTYKYMAPEVFRGEHYDGTVDIYSLGIVLFTLLNGNRGPFLPLPPAKITHNDEEEARMRRFRGEAIPAPRDADPMLAYIIQKACIADPSQRYRTAEQMRRDLESYLTNYNNQTEKILGGGISEEIAFDPILRSYTGNVSAKDITAATGQYSAQQFGQSRFDQNSYVQPRSIPNASAKKRRSIIPLLIAGVVLSIAIGAAAYFAIQSANRIDSLDLTDLMAEPAVVGYNGRGGIESAITVDESKKQAVIDRVKKAEEKEKLDQLISSVIYTPDISEGLSNGDAVIIQATYNTDIASELRINITGTAAALTVSGLEDFPAYLEGALEYDGHYYKVVNESLYWDEAKEACEAENGHLATITSAEEQSIIRTLIEDTGSKYNYWLGGTDEGHEGTWTWITGEPWAYSNWRKNQPDNGTIGKVPSQNYLQICLVSAEDTGRYGKWWDEGVEGISPNYMMAPYFKDTQYTGYICEWDGI